MSDQRRTFYILRDTLHGEGLQLLARLFVGNATQKTPHSWPQIGTKLVEVVEHAVAARPTDIGFYSRLECNRPRRIISRHADADDGNPIRIQLGPRDQVVDASFDWCFIVGSRGNS